MEDRDLASNLEFWSGRARHIGAGEDPRRRRRSLRGTSLRITGFRLPRPLVAPRGRARPMAAAALLATLAAAWLVAGHRSHASAAVDAQPSLGASPSGLPPSLVPPRSSSSSVAATTTTVPRTRDCRGLTVNRREVRCSVDGIDLDVRLYSLGTVAPAYRRAAGADGEARSGLPACARGVPDERAWSVAAFPEAAVGRYRCRFEHGHAAMWWTHRDRLFHAVAPDGDLAGLFSWWRSHPSE